MDEFWRDFWWLIFPVGAFLYGAWDRWLAYRRRRDALDLIKTLSAQGKDLPPELLREVREEAFDPDPFAGGAYAGDRYARRAARRYYRWRHAPYRRWHAAIVTGAVAAGFWAASEYSGVVEAEGAFRVVAIVLTCVAGANLLLALLAGGLRDR